VLLCFIHSDVEEMLCFCHLCCCCVLNDSVDCFCHEEEMKHCILMRKSIEGEIVEKGAG